MKKLLVLLFMTVCMVSCKNTVEKQEVKPILLNEDLKAIITLKGGEKITVTNKLDNIKVADIEHIKLFKENSSYELLYKDSEQKYARLLLKDNTKTSPIDRDKVLIVINGEQKDKEFDLNSISADSIQSINVYKGADKIKEKFNTTAFESVIEIFTK